MREPTQSEAVDRIRSTSLPWAVKELLAAGLIVGLSPKEMLLSSLVEELA